MAGGGLAGALAKLDDLSDGTAFVLGHNLLAFDLPQLQAVNPDLRLLRRPAVDTLRLNPLAFPRNPYHHLVKHYQDGQLQRGRINDPELDARLALEVFDNQLKALQEAPSDLLTRLALAHHAGRWRRISPRLRIAAGRAKAVCGRGVGRDTHPAGYQRLPDAHA